MKKVLCLLAVLAMASVSFAGTVTIEATPTDCGIEITYTGDAPLGLALTVTGVEITEYVAGSTDSFFDVYIDYASGLEGDPTGWDLVGGTPLAAVEAAGEATLPAAAVSICVGHLAADTDGTGNVAALVVAEGEYTIAIDALRGGAVDADGAMTVVGLPVTITVACGGECLGDVSGGDGNPDGRVGILDVLKLINILKTSELDDKGRVTPVPPGLEAGDVSGGDGNPDGSIGILDILAIINHINTSELDDKGRADCM